MCRGGCVYKLRSFSSILSRGGNVRVVFKVLVQGERDRCRPVMLELYPQESIGDMVWQPFALLVQDVCCETFVHAMYEVCSQAVVCVVHAWPGTASLFLRVDGSPYMTNRCVEKCACISCAAAIVVVITNWRSGFSAIRWSSLLCAVTKGRSGTVVRKVGPCTTVGAQPALYTSDRGHCFMPQVGMSLIPPEIRVAGSHGAELPIVLKPSI